MHIPILKNLSFKFKQKRRRNFLKGLFCLSPDVVIEDSLVSTDVSPPPPLASVSNDVLTEDIPNRNIPRLLPELLDIICEHLHDDEDALKATSLVSRDWSYSSQRILLHSLDILYHTPSTLSKFIACLENSTNMSIFVRRLRVHGKNVWTTAAHSVAQVQRSHIDSIFTHLPSLQELDLSIVLIECGKLESESQPCNRYTLNKLRLRPTLPSTLEGIKKALSVLEMFSEIGQLELGSCILDHDSEELGEGIVGSIQFPRIRHLSFGRCRNDIDPFFLDLILPSIQKAAEVNPLSSLDWMCCHRPTPALQSFLNAVAPSLVELKFEIGPDHRAYWEKHITFLYKCTSLRRAVVPIWSCDLLAHHTPWSHALMVLQYLPRTVSEIEIQFTCIDDSGFPDSDSDMSFPERKFMRTLEEADWINMDVVLCRVCDSNFDVPKSVIFSCSGVRDDYIQGFQLTKIIQKGLHSFNQRRPLNIWHRPGTIGEYTKMIIPATIEEHLKFYVKGASAYDLARREKVNRWLG
ncbi:hypothetical protein K474DRAFT_1668889 [Panus rudis PR-1116 ss-1]|nr:hypothetical protein K474DRAFT_1668889 [Panus rudis PR-1116 ss-1]